MGVKKKFIDCTRDKVGVVEFVSTMSQYIVYETCDYRDTLNIARSRFS